jgi:23S rRNA pseudouridine1911/1915/1917 synthase
MENSKSLYEHYSFLVERGQEPLRIDKYLMNFVENATRSKIQAAAKLGSIHVNGSIVKSNYKVKPNDNIKVLFEHPPQENIIVPENINLNIIFEDDDILVLNKPAGMVVHPGHGNRTGTLINGLVYHFNNLPNNSSNRPGLVHRIDKNTSGLLVVAKNENAMTKLSDQFAKKTSKREYIALVWGNVKQDSGTIDEIIGRNPKNRLQNIVFHNHDSQSGKNAITHYKVIQRYGYVTLVSCTLETGRTHQIRVHMKYIGHTLFNDETYGGNLILKGTTFTKYKQFVDNCFKVLPRQALHAKSLGFIHPKTNQFVEFNSDIPFDMKECLKKWDSYAKHQM